MVSQITVEYMYQNNIKETMNMTGEYEKADINTGQTRERNTIEEKQKEVAVMSVEGIVIGSNGIGGREKFTGRGNVIGTFSETERGMFTYMIGIGNIPN